DWGDGQRPKRGRGRIYRIAYSGTNAAPQAPPATETTVEELLSQLDSPSYLARVDAQTALERHGLGGLEAVPQALKKGARGLPGRRHAVWILAALGGPKSVDELFGIAASDPESSVRGQCVRAIADLTDPVLVEDKLDAGRGDPKIAIRLSHVADADHPR